NAKLTDDPMLGPRLGLPIKFGLPPYYGLITNKIVLTNSFENVNLLTNMTNFDQRGPLPLPVTFDKWQVQSNGVAVFSDTNHPYQGLPKNGLIGCFSFSPDMLTSNTAAGLPFYVGTNVTSYDGTNYFVLSAPRDPGDYYLFLGINNNNFDVLPPVTTNANF